MTAWGSVAELLGEDLDGIEFLGRGSSGTVYRATQRSLGRTVAVKVFRRFAEDETDRVLAEARAQAMLSWQANIVSLYSHGVTPDGFPYLVMEYAPGGSLADRIEDRGPLPEEEWRRMGAELAAALAAAHDAGVIHCDVKPSNVLFAADGSARLADFGIARATGMTSGTLDSIAGSLAYVPPELLDGEKPQPANDVYSLALTLIYAATGAQPLEGLVSRPALVAKIRSGAPPLPAPLLKIDQRAKQALERGLASDPTRRPSAAQICSDVARKNESDGSESPRRIARLGQSARVAVSLAIVVALLGSVLVVGGWSRGSRETPPSTCSQFQRYLSMRRALFDQVSADLEQSSDPSVVIERLLITYPAEAAKIIVPFLNAQARAAGSSEVTLAEIGQLSRVDAMRAISGGKQFLFDGQSGELDIRSLPPELRHPADRVFGHQFACLG